MADLFLLHELLQRISDITVLKVYKQIYTYKTYAADANAYF